MLERQITVLWDRLVLINSVLTSLPMFMLSFLEILVGLRKRLDFYRSRFFFGSPMKIRENIDLQNRILFADPKIKGVWVLRFLN
jgi:hypothetical protein